MGLIMSRKFFSKHIKNKKPSVSSTQFVSENTQDSGHLKLSLLSLSDKEIRDLSAHDVREQLLQWAKRAWPESTPMTLNKLAEITTAEIAEELNQLNQVLYGDPETDWSAIHLIRLLKDFLAQKKAVENSESGLEPLYKN